MYAEHVADEQFTISEMALALVLQEDIPECRTAPIDIVIRIARRYISRGDAAPEILRGILDAIRQQFEDMGIDPDMAMPEPTGSAH